MIKWLAGIIGAIIAGLIITLITNYFQNLSPQPPQVITKEQINDLPKKEDPLKRQDSLKQFKPTVYQMYKKYLFLYRELEKNAKPLNDKNRKEIKEWFININFQNLPQPEQNDLTKFSNAVVSYLNNTPAQDGYEKGQQFAKVLETVLPVLVDFEINKSKAITDGYPELAEKIDEAIQIFASLFFKTYEIDIEGLRIRPVVKLLVALSIGDL